MATQKEVKNRIAGQEHQQDHAGDGDGRGGAAAPRRAADRRPAPLRPGDAQADPRAAEQAGGIPRVPVLSRARGGAPGRDPAGHRGPRPGRRLQHEHHPRGAAPEARVRARRGVESPSPSSAAQGVSALTFRKQDLLESYTGFTDRPGFANAREIGEELTSALRRRGARPGRADLQPLRLAADPVRRRQTLLPVQQAEVFGEGVPQEEEHEETEIEKAHSRGALDLRARARGAARDS